MKQGRNESAKKNEGGDVNSDLKQGQDVCFTVQTLHLQGEAHTAAIPIQQDNITGEASDTVEKPSHAETVNRQNEPFRQEVVTLG